MYQIILDTNVIVSALRSNRGAAFRLVSLIPDDRFETNLSVPLVVEYEAVTKRPDQNLALSEIEIDDVLNFLCKNSNQRRVFYLWRPMLTDPDDDFLLELAVECNCDFIVTFNTSDFAKTSDFDINVVTPRAFLQLIGEIE